MNRDRKPLPRFWYFPRWLKAVIVGTGDDHGNGGTAGRFDQYMANSAVGLLRGRLGLPALHLLHLPGTPLTNAKPRSYNDQGFEVGVHPDTGCADFTPASSAQTFSTQLAQFRAKYRALPRPTTNRTHCLVWSDWSSQAEDRAGERHAAGRHLLLLAGAPGSRTGPGS